MVILDSRFVGLAFSVVEYWILISFLYPHSRREGRYIFFAATPPAPILCNGVVSGIRRELGAFILQNAAMAWVMNW